MDFKQLWLNTQDLWGALDQHPLLHAGIGLALLLVVALLAVSYTHLTLPTTPYV